MLSDAIKAEASRLGFDLAGIAPAVNAPGFPSFVDWLDHGYAGEMHYLPRRRDAYAAPQSVLDGARSVIMLGLSYHRPGSSTAPNDAIEKIPAQVSSYASGTRDYHDVLREKLSLLGDFLEQRQPGCNTRGVVDTAPLLERDFARLAGLGWFGKNTLLLNRRAGSWFFLAALLVDCELEYDDPQASSHCGTCTRCLDACPTDAFVAPYVLDARRCISYLTIEHRGPIPAELRDGVGDWLFGCDICQDVCPWNRKATPTREPAFAQETADEHLDAIELLGLSDDEFRKRFRHTPLARPKRAGILRNACLVLGNGGNSAAIPALISALQDEESVIRGAAAWALGKLGGATASEALALRQLIEVDEHVRKEITAALQR